MSDPGAVIVGGVGEGLGLAIAMRLAIAGHPVIMLARSAERLKQFEQKIAAAGGAAHGRSTDVRDEQYVVALFDQVAAEYGPIDAAIYNAGAQRRKPVLRITGATFENVWRLGCFAAFVFGREAVRQMLPHRKSTVIFTGATGLKSC